MKNSNFLDTVSRGIHKVSFVLKKHSPEILVGAGVVGGVVSAVMACKATTKLEAITKEAKENIEAINHGFEHPETLTEEYTEEDRNKDLAIVYARTGFEIVKLYGPSVVLGAASVISILSGHNILRKRNVAIAAAYTAIDTGFKEYRGRVVERFGKELDKELRYNIQAKEVEEIVVDENGETHVEKKVIEDVVGIDGYSVYARFYDDGCKGWRKDPEHNLTFLIQQQRHANDLLRKKHIVFLNDVYEMLGMQKTKAGQSVGWVYDKNRPNGDNFIDFGIHDVHKPASRDFVNGYERVILLDFNVDGNILGYLR